MASPAALLDERLPAVLAFEASIVRMDPHVLLQGPPPAVRLVAHRTFEITHARMLQHVYLHFGQREEGHLALRALVVALYQVHPLYVNA